MIDPEIIIEEAKNNDEPTIKLNMIEFNFFLSIKRIMCLYKLNGFPKEVAERMKTQAIGNYKKDTRIKDFQDSIFKKHIEINRRTEMARIKLHKLLNNKEADKDEIIKTCMEIISIDYEKEFKNHLYEERNYIDDNGRKENLS